VTGGSALTYLTYIFWLINFAKVFVGTWTRTWTFRAYDYLVEEWAEVRRTRETQRWGTGQPAGRGCEVEMGVEAVPAGEVRSILSSFDCQ
jgi:hypothetical protein